MLAELALLGVSLATVVGYARLFADGAFLLPIAAAAVVGHGIAVLLRRVGLGPLLSTVAHLSLLPLFLAWTRYHTTTANLLPSGRTLDAISGDVADAWDIFLDISAPVPAAPGFIVVAMATAWVVALASDSLAFRLDATVEALAPATGLFLFASILADEEHRTTSAALFVVAALTFVLAARVARADGTGRWLATDAGAGPAPSSSPAPSSARSRSSRRCWPAPACRAPTVSRWSTSTAVVAATTGSRSVPWSTSAPGWSTRSRRRGVPGRGGLAHLLATHCPGRVRRADLVLLGLLRRSGGSAARHPRARPRRHPPHPTLPHRGPRPDLAARRVRAPRRRQPRGRHRLGWRLLLPGRRHRPGDLRRTRVRRGLDPATASAREPLGRHVGLDTEFLARFTRLPEATRPIADRYAAEVGSEPDAYEQALALQTWFRTGFRYSLDVPPGHSTNALAEFLDPEGSRSGYCEQFAGAYAALARSLGLPARVAVGFTPGEEDEDAPGTYVVTGRNAHAWPEVYFAGVGWVPFEPTPGRGAPGAEAYTGLAPDQATPEESVVPTSLPTTAAPGTEPQLSQPLEELLPETSHRRRTGAAAVPRRSPCSSSPWPASARCGWSASPSPVRSVGGDATSGPGATPTAR